MMFVGDVSEIDTDLAMLLRSSGTMRTAAPPEAIIERARFHGILGLLGSLPPASIAPPLLHEPLVRESKLLAMWELRHAEEMRNLCSEFDHKSVDHAFLKGTALAYSVYQQPFQRSRSDSDILVRPAQLRESQRILEDAGFMPVTAVVRPSIELQQPWIKRLADGSAHTVDLHWSLINSHTLKGLLPVDECLDDAVALPRLAPQARTLSGPMLLIHAAIHRSMHRTAPFFFNDQRIVNPDRLIWAEDAIALTSRFNDEDWAKLSRITNQLGIPNVVQEFLDFSERVARRGASTIPWRQVFQPNPASSEEERYLLSTSRFARAAKDWARLKGSRDKLAFLFRAMNRRLRALKAG